MAVKETRVATQLSEQQKRERRATLAFVGTGLGFLLGGIAIGIPANISAAAQAREDMGVRAEGYRQCADFVRANHVRDIALDALSAELQQRCGVRQAIESGEYTSESEGNVRTYRLPDALEGKVTATVVEYSKHSKTLSGVVATLPTAENLESVAAGLETQSQQGNSNQDGLAGAGWGALAGFAGFGAIARNNPLFTARQD